VIVNGLTANRDKQNRSMPQRKNRRTRSEIAIASASADSKLATRPWQRRNVQAWAGGFVILACVFAVYASSMQAPMIFDDTSTIVNNESIKQLWPLIGTVSEPGPLRPPRKSSTAGRPLVNLSFAVNHAIAGESPLGYRLVNLGLHLASTILVWSIVRRTLLLDFFGGRFIDVAGMLGFLTALLWSVHPLLTEAVEYITQRTELMMAFCYLAALYASLRYWAANGTRSRALWLLLGVIACLAGMSSKEMMVTAPVVILLFERTFVSGSFRRALRYSWPLYIGLCLSWMLLGALNIGGPRADSTGFGHGLPAHYYWFTQAKVLLLYFKLSVWPWPLVIHYHYPYFQTFTSAAPWILPVVLLAALTGVLVWRRMAAGFVLASVLLILSPTLVVPILTEVAAERRMYLPLVALMALAVVGTYCVSQWALGEPSERMARSAHGGQSLVATCIAGGLLAIIYMSVSAHRLSAYAEPLQIWQDALNYSPSSAFVQNNVGMSLVALGRSGEAIPHFEAAVRLEPDSAKSYMHLGFALLAAHRPQDAVQPFRRVVELDPRSSSANDNYGFALTLAGRPEEAITYITRAMELDPQAAEPVHNMGLALAGLKRLDEAVHYFETALAMKPEYAEAATNLGITELRRGHPQQAVVALRRALESRPEQFEAVFPLAAAYDEMKQPAVAIATVDAALNFARERGSSAHIKQFSEWLSARRMVTNRP
jgi:Flp pilus assembly protein TadD